ncbi:hypothetical protein WP2W18E10_42290 [Escherichia coli]|nr:hypothetical protein WP2W18E10_42290 [Escherichia coli]
MKGYSRKKNLMHILEAKDKKWFFWIIFSDIT